VLDSGASFHVTSDKSPLASSTPVIDGTSVQTADGTSCPITHQGSLCNSYFSVLQLAKLLIEIVLLVLMMLGTPHSSVTEGTQLRARKRSEMAKRTVKAKRTRPKALERREESAGNSRPKGSEEAARHGEGTYGEVGPRAPSTR